MRGRQSTKAKAHPVEKPERHIWEAPKTYDSTVQAALDALGVDAHTLARQLGCLTAELEAQKPHHLVLEELASLVRLRIGLLLQTRELLHRRLRDEYARQMIQRMKVRP